MSRFVLIGHPVGHSLSKVIHQAAYRALSLDHEYELFDAPDEPAVEKAFDQLRRGELEGANVTVPWKRLALRLADRVDPQAAAIGAANVLVREKDDRVTAYNTDAPALADEIRAAAATARTACVIGNGGAALAAVSACRSLGLQPVNVVARAFRSEHAETSWPLASELRRLGATPLAWPTQNFEASGGWSEHVRRADVILQATSAGMSGGGPGEAVRDIVPWDELGSSVLALDLVYNPAVTPFLNAALAAGLRVEGGLGMLVGQAARAMELWLSVKAPRDVLRAAAEREISTRSRA